MRTTAVIPALLLTSALALTGCTAGPGGSPEPDPAPPTPDAACEVGHWVLDVADFASQSEAFLTGQDIPITDFAMTGDGTLDIGADGFLDGVVSLTSTGTLVVPDHAPVPVSVPSSYTFSGQWSAGEEPGTIDLSNWAQVADVGGDGEDMAPFLDFSDVPTVSSQCDAESLRLQGPDAPLSALWHRA